MKALNHKQIEDKECCERWTAHLRNLASSCSQNGMRVLAAQIRQSAVHIERAKDLQVELIMNADKYMDAALFGEPVSKYEGDQ